MMVLDTNVVSELMRAAPHPQVLAWLDGQHMADVCLTSVTVAELLYGVARLPPGKRQRDLAVLVADMLSEDFGGRILAFDAESAAAYAECVVRREQQGQPISMADAQIAAICLVHGASLVTRNVRDFVGTGVALRNPWDV